MQQLRTVVVYSRIGSELLANGDASGALSNNRRELAILEPLAAADRRNGVLQVHLAASLAETGRAAIKAGQITGGLGMLNTAAKIANEQISQDPANVEPRDILATILDFQGEASASPTAVKPRPSCNFAAPFLSSKNSAKPIRRTWMFC